MVQAFETHLREIVLRAQAQVLAQLQQKLSITDGTIDATPANMRVMRNAGPLFMDEMRRQGYDRLVEAFAGEFRGTLPFLQETIQQLGEQVQKEWPDLGFGAKDLNLLAATQANAAVSIEAAVESVAGAAMTRGLFSVAGLRFGELAEMLTEKFETSIGKARTIADTSMSTFYATATDRAFQIIEKDLPEQVQHYKYSGPDDKLTRPFCEHLLKLGKAYTREEIGKMDNGQLPNVMITRGGWNCRHQWILDIEAMAAVNAQEGVPFRRLQSDLSTQKTGQVLKALGDPAVAAALKKTPIESILIARLPDRDHPAWYDYSTKSVSINSARKLGVHFGESFEPGKTWSMSGATPDKQESLRRSLLQETAHHLQSSVPGIDAVVREAWIDPKRLPITRYAASDPLEYFAESLTAFFVEKEYC